MASVEPNSNRSQFFFMLDAAPELTNKNTLFGKVSGNTLYNMLALGETGLEEDGRPSKKNYIFKAEVCLFMFMLFEWFKNCLKLDETFTRVMIEVNTLGDFFFRKKF